MKMVQEQIKETKLLEQLIALFLPSTEMGKVWERAVWNEDAEQWTLPTIKPRKAFSQVVKLPTLGGGGGSHAPADDEELPDDLITGGGVVVSDGEARGHSRRARSRSKVC